VDDVDATLRAAMSAASAQSTARASEEQRLQDESARLVSDLAARREAIRAELIALGERTIDLLSSAPGRGGLKSVTVAKGRFGRRVQMEGWPMPGDSSKEKYLFLPSKEVVFFMPDYLDKPPVRRSIADWVGLHLRYVMVSLGGDSGAVELTEWSRESSGYYADRGLAPQMRQALEAGRAGLIQRYARLLGEAGISL
jgi:hypothetical protein